VQRLRRLKSALAPRLRSFSLLQPLPALVQALNDWAPTTLATYPTAAALLADEAAAGRLRLPLHELMTGGETLSAGVRHRIVHGLGCPVHDRYGASECLTIAGECSHGRLHLNADGVVLEPMDDRVRLPDAPCACGSPLPLLEVLGRHDDPLRLGAGAAATPALFERCRAALPGYAAAQGRVRRRRGAEPGTPSRY
jgi:phenylacetate-CoA ligase